MPIQNPLNLVHAIIVLWFSIVYRNEFPETKNKLERKLKVETKKILTAFPEKFKSPKNDPREPVNENIDNGTI